MTVTEAHRALANAKAKVAEAEGAERDARYRLDDALANVGRAGGRAHSHASADLALARAVKAAGIARAPTWHDMRHSHVSRLFAVSAMPLPPTVLSVYAHQYSDARRRASESDELGALYDRGSAMEAPDGNAAQQTATPAVANLRPARAKRSAAQ